MDGCVQVCLTEQMDTHDVSLQRGNYPDILEEIKQPCCVIGISSDVLYPVCEQEELAAHIQVSLGSDCGASFGS